MRSKATKVGVQPSLSVLSTKPSTVRSIEGSTVRSTEKSTVRSTKRSSELLPEREKLLATAGFTEAADGAADGEQRISAYVSPCFVKKGNFLASITGATNAVQIQSASLGQSTLVGQGAGR